MKLMVIGANGNLGSELRRQAAHPVVAVGRAEWQDLTDRDLAGVDVIIHAAADLYSSATDKPSAMIHSGPQLTARLLEMMGAHGTPRLMYASSCAVYGVASTTEDAAPCCPLTINGQLNLLNERLIETYCTHHGIQWEAYRLFNTFGGTDRFSVVSRIISAVRGDRTLTVNNNGFSQRDFVHVGDIASILLELIEQRPPHVRLNIGTGHATKIGDLVAAASAIHPCFQANFAPTQDSVMISVADTKRLLGCIKPRRFVSVLDYLRDILV